MRPDPSYARAVSAWTTHLRSGGSTPWAVWLGEYADPGEVPHTGAPTQPLPDAIHLELVRRINLAAERSHPAGRAHEELVDQVLATAAPGRGLVDVPLPWPGSHGFGTPAVDPEALPVEELARLASGVLARLLPGVPPEPRHERETPWPLPWRRRFRLHGPPQTVAALRERLLASGLVESDRRTTDVVVGLPVDVAVAEYWAGRVQHGGILKWRAVWNRARARGGLPAAVDVAATADRLRRRPGATVHAVVARDAATAADLVAEALGAHRRRASPPGLSSPPDLSACDLLRRVNRLTALTHDSAGVARLARRLHEVIEEVTGSAGAGAAPPVLVPRPALAWARERAADAARDLRAAGYPVHGDPDALVPTGHRSLGAVETERTLALAVAACLRVWELSGQPHGQPDGQLEEGGGQP